MCVCVCAHCNSAVRTEGGCRNDGPPRSQAGDTEQEYPRRMATPSHVNGLHVQAVSNLVLFFFCILSFSLFLSSNNRCLCSRYPSRVWSGHFAILPGKYSWRRIRQLRLRRDIYEGRRERSPRVCCDGFFRRPSCATAGRGDGVRDVISTVEFSAACLIFRLFPFFSFFVLPPFPPAFLLLTLRGQHISTVEKPESSPPLLPSFLPPLFL